ncbi:DUF4177 domain-containing protein [Desnuesiella massiliensis]|uniref:DUF4177 domain-containing protein n=1 Tax=Desnuesiella massiliensis TaxID=1650662 RepID=UPI0006E2A9CA|nr:DUF4177 domain-containing protein [Desnuesiella massiliensis]
MKWEYKVIQIEKYEGLKDSVELPKELNDYGTEGWKVVGVLQPQHNEKVGISNSYTNAVTFKRRIED